MTKKEKKIIKKAVVILLKKIKQLPALLLRDRKYVITKLIIIVAAGWSVLDLLSGSVDRMEAEIKTAQCAISLAFLFMPMTAIYEKDFDVHRSRKDRKEEE